MSDQAAAAVVELLVGDPIAWMRERPGVVPAIVLALPDASELGPWSGGESVMEAWHEWARMLLDASFQALAPGGPMVIWCTDRKHNREVFSRHYLVHARALINDTPCVLHKVGLTRRGASLFRPGFSHLLMYGRGLRPPEPTPDAFIAGPGIDREDIPFVAAKLAVRAALDTGASVIVDPWVGSGTIPVLAVALGAQGVVGICGTEAKRERAAKLSVYDFTRIAKRVPGPDEPPIPGMPEDERADGP